ncbi:MAG: hypothetical protein A2Y07_05580 [Planctomycetes bacterium GWF2_50_10]|nr:MAG: hypothetical protein A2Y07_05580 [Planctomycetes bacterium GWF2_50_10]
MSFEEALPVTDLAVIVEGQSELAFVNSTLQEHLRGHGVDAWGRLPGKHVQCGGIPKWDIVRGDICRTLKERTSRRCTIFFDFYGMPHSWPGRREAASASFSQKAEMVEAAIAEDIATVMGSDFRRELFIPYVQMHEFEALLFSDVDQMSRQLCVVNSCSDEGSHSRMRNNLQKILETAGSAEQINDSANTAPSKRILGIAPGYRKAISGPIILGRIGIPQIRQKCPHFNQWLTNLEALGSSY